MKYPRVFYVMLVALFCSMDFVSSTRPNSASDMADGGAGFPRFRDSLCPTVFASVVTAIHQHTGHSVDVFNFDFVECLTLQELQYIKRILSDLVMLAIPTASLSLEMELADCLGEALYHPILQEIVRRPTSQTSAASEVRPEWCPARLSLDAEHAFPLSSDRCSDMLDEWFPTIIESDDIAAGMHDWHDVSFLDNLSVPDICELYKLVNEERLWLHSRHDMWHTVGIAPPFEMFPAYLCYLQHLHNSMLSLTIEDSSGIVVISRVCPRKESTHPIMPPPMYPEPILPVHPSIESPVLETPMNPVSSQNEIDQPILSEPAKRHLGGLQRATALLRAMKSKTTTW